MFGDFGENVFGVLEKPCSAILEKMCSEIFEKTCWATWRNRVRRFGETVRRKHWRNVVGAVMVTLYWSSLWRSIELGDRKWRLNHNREKVETSYGDQNFIQYKVESTCLERFKDRNI